ncbi:MAG: glycerophosphodiester phosphodiesterase, partial [Bacteroidetes bacterium]|nr:glycerophosphodiester phosphodiesterase [Bacteroidota bacterium]
MFTKILKWFFIGFIGLVVVAAAIFLMLGGGFGERADRFSVNKDAPIVFAHKGLANYYAESSMASIIASVNMGFTAIEVDVTVTKDHRLIVFHDDSGKRLLGIEDDITDLNFEDIQRKALTFNGMKTEERIIPLDEFLSTYGDSLIIYLDIKIARKSVADTLIAYLERYNLYNTTLIADADLMFLSYLKYQEPKAKTILEGFSSGKEWTYSLIPRNFKPDYYSTSIG